MEVLIRDGSPLEADNVEDVALDLSQAQIGITHANFVVPINDFAPNDPREGDLSQDPDASFIPTQQILVHNELGEYLMDKNKWPTLVIQNEQELSAVQENSQEGQLTDEEGIG